MRPFPGVPAIIVLALGLFAPLLSLDADCAAKEAPTIEEESLRLHAEPEIGPAPIALPLEVPQGTPGRPVLEVLSSLIDESILRKHLHYQDSLSVP